MSVKVSGIIWDYYPNGGGELLTALALADHANHEGGSIFPTIATVARMTRQDRRTVQRHVRSMIESGWLEVVERGVGRANTTKYRIPLERIGPLWPEEKVANCHPLPIRQDEPESVDNVVDNLVDNSPDEDTKGDKRVTERAASDAEKGGIAMSHRTSLSVKQKESDLKDNPETHPALAGMGSKWWETSAGIETVARRLGMVFEHSADRYVLKLQVMARLPSGPWRDYRNATAEAQIQQIRESLAEEAA